MGVEFEVKFRGTPEQQAAILAAYGRNPRMIQMETTYYDTPDSALSNRYYTLRCRKENEESVCTLKTPAKDIGRGEFAVACSDIEQALPSLCALSGVTDLLTLTAGGILPVCGARFTRTAFCVETDLCKAEIALDTGILTGGEKSIPLCEIEVELLTGSQEGLLALARKLAIEFGLIPEKKSKFRRAFALSKDV